jgi:hypothetical protein
LKRLLTVSDEDEDTDIDEFDEAVAELDTSPAAAPKPDPNRPMTSVEIDRRRAELGYVNSTKKVDPSVATLMSREYIMKSSIAVEAARGGRPASSLAPAAPPKQPAPQRSTRTRGSEGLE